MSDEPKKPVCYGVMEEVFPLSEDGLRHSPERCMACPHKTQCLRSALSSDPEADTVREERIDRAYDAGNLSFLARWSRKKALAGKGKKGKV